MQNYPPMIKYEGIIRLKVAAICASLDTLILNGDEDEEEVAPFLAKVEKRYFDRRMQKEYTTSGTVEPHAFLYLSPTGSLEEHVSLVLSALTGSIANRELRPIQLRVDLQTDIINAEETWITTKDFYDWCASRNLEFGDLCSRYEDAENDIVDRIDGAVYDARRDYETPLFDPSYPKRVSLDSIEKDALEREYESLFRENIFLRNGLIPESETSNNRHSHGGEKPLRTTERNALLSIIAVLCDESGYDTDRAAKTAAVIKTRADLAGIDLGETTIENHLKKIPDAVTRRLRREEK